MISATTPLHASLDKGIWEDDLEVNVGHWQDRMANSGYLRRWMEERTKKQIAVLCRHFGLGELPKLKQQREALRQHLGELASFFLVSRFAYRKSRAAIVSAANLHLEPDVISLCMNDDNQPDKLALLFAIYSAGQDFLKTVLHLDKAHTTGFARMAIRGNVRSPRGTFKDYLKDAVVEQCLKTHDSNAKDGRESQLKGILDRGERVQVFIRRGYKQTMVITDRLLHGFQPEWIVLSFHKDAKRVDIASHSISTPVEIANDIASGYFGTAIEYENDIIETYRAQIRKLLDDLIAGNSNSFSLVDVDVLSSPLDGTPSLKLYGEDPICAGISHFGTAVGPLLSNIGSIKSIKALFENKRVKVMFEQLESDPDQFVVRYQDHSLSEEERFRFEDTMRLEHGIQVLSTEKRHKRDR